MLVVNFMNIYKFEKPSKQIINYTDEEKKLLDEYFKIEKFYRYALNEMNARVENLEDYCYLTYDHNPIHNIESRIKTPEAIIEKIKRRGYSLTFDTLTNYLYDIAGMRIICNYLNDIYQIIDLLSTQKDIKIRLKKDYILNPKVSGYRSIHVIFDMNIYTDRTLRTIPVEIQFRTIAMDMWASLEHELRYKSNNSFSEEDKFNLRKYSDDLYQVDLNMQKIFINKNSIGGSSDD